MKSKIISLIAAAGFFLTACTTSYKSTSDSAAYNVDVPTGIRSSFAISYPDATNVAWNRYDVNNVPIDWELAEWNSLGANDYAVTFNMGSDQYYAWYDANGNLIGTATVVSDYSRLPYAVNTTLRDKYNGYTIDHVGKEMVGSKTAYELRLSRGDNKIKLLVDSDGNVLKEKLK